MHLSNSKAYALLIFACAAGYAWVFFASRYDFTKETFVVCPMKHMTHVPCPSCGSTRAVVSFLNGDVSGSLALNPIGLLLLMIMTISPLWAAYDLVRNKTTLLVFYQRSQRLLRKRLFAIAFALLIAGNWIWNIYKGV